MRDTSRKRGQMTVCCAEMLTLGGTWGFLHVGFLMQRGPSNWGKMEVWCKAFIKLFPVKVGYVWGPDDSLGAQNCPGSRHLRSRTEMQQPGCQGPLLQMHGSTKPTGTGAHEEIHTCPQG